MSVEKKPRDYLQYLQLVLTGVLIAVLVAPSGQLLSMGDLILKFTKEINENTNRNFEQMISLQNQVETNRQSAENDRQQKQDEIVTNDAIQGNQTLAFFVPVILDIDEDIEQIKKVLNITRNSSDDLIKLKIIEDEIILNNQTRLPIPQFNGITGNQTIVP